MNERIQELALAAGKYADETQPRGSYTRDGMWLYAYNEKFAELIVRECIDTAFHRGHPDLEFLLKHFGVEESGINQQLRNRSTYFGNNP